MISRMANSNREKMTIYNMKMAGFLMQRGFVLIGMEPNNNGSGKNVFFFFKSNAMEQAMEEFITKHNR